MLQIERKKRRELAEEISSVKDA